MIPDATVRRLEAGPLSFTAYETGEGPLVLLLHGFPDTPATWRYLAPALAAAGYRAVAVTARGYEPSSQPADGDFSMAALAGDVVGWIDALGADRAHLVGHDWGASIMHAVAASAPERVASLTALAVPHPAGFAGLLASDLDQIERSWYIFFIVSSALADGLVSAPDGAFLERLWRRWSPGWPPDQAVFADMLETFRRPGVVSSALGYYRAAFDADHPRAKDNLALWGAPITCPVLGIAGANDGCISADIFRRAMAGPFFAQAPEVVVLEHAGHFLHLEQRDEVTGHVLQWLDRHG